MAAKPLATEPSKALEDSVLHVAAEVPGEVSQTSASFAEILKQALLAKDTHLLDSVLQNDDISVVRRTVQEIPGGFCVEQLLPELVQRLEQTPLRAQFMCYWIREILLQHMSLFASVPALRQGLERLERHATLRVQTHRSLVGLQGEIDNIVFNGYRTIERHAAKDNFVESFREPLLEYKEPA